MLRFSNLPSAIPFLLLHRSQKIDGFLKGKQTTYKKCGNTNLKKKSFKTVQIIHDSYRNVHEIP